ncbi:MAG: hypothetical protein GX587_10305 [Bacteroidales bacterium]|nr:hypothetical protein [Bacteroidales bacterium]
MKYIFKSILLFCFSGFLLILSSCQDSNTCDQIIETPLVVDFAVAVDSVTVNDTTIKAVTVICPELPDTVLIDNKNTGQFELFLNPNDDFSRFAISVSVPNQINDTLIENITLFDTLKIQYTRKPVLLSTACGFILNFEIASVAYSGQIIDSIKVENKLVSNERKDHLKIIVPRSGFTIPSK